MRRELERLQDIIEAIALIQKYYRAETFEDDELLQAAILHYLQIIGEASRGISEAFQTAQNQVNWSGIIGFRNILTHQYFRIDLNIVKHIIEHDLPVLKNQVETILQQASLTDKDQENLKPHEIF